MEMGLKEILVPAIAAIASVSLLMTIRSIAFRLLHKWAESTETHIDDIIIKSLKMPSIFWCIAIGLYIGLSFSELPQKHVFYLNRIIHIIIIFSITIAISNLAGRIFKNYVQKLSLPIPTTGLVYGILKGSILIIGFLIALSFLGISITPIITALGVGGLAVALALKDTLANLFSGMHILVEKSIRVGDFIKLQTGQEGFVEDITWRTTRIRMMPNNMVVIPNSILAQSIVINYCLPEKRMSFSIPVGVSYSSDPEKIESILLQEAKKAATDVSGLLAEPEPSVRFTGFGESSLDFTLVLHVKEFADQFPVQHELRKRIFRRFKEEGIEIPFPQRTVHLKKER